MTKAQESSLSKKIDGVEEDSRRAIVMLIAEHSKITEQRNFDGEDVELPYNGIQDGNDTVFDLKNFPNDLKWILWKFVNLGSK